jgi:hypothetical protein
MIQRVALILGRRARLGLFGCAVNKHLGNTKSWLGAQRKTPPWGIF